MPLNDPIRPPLKVLDLPRVAAPPPAPSMVSSAGGRHSLGGGGSDIATQRVQIAQSAQDLREQRFEHRSDLDEANLSLAQQKQLLDRAKLTETLMVHRAALQTEYRKTISSAAAIEALTQLDPTDPKFQKQWGEIAAKYSDGFATPAVKAVTGQLFKDYQNHQTAQKERTLSSFTDPDVAAAYEKALPHGEQFANGQAKATEALKKQALAVVADPNAAAFHDKIYNAQTGAFNLDPTVITQASVAAASAKAASSKGTAAVKDLGTLAHAAKALTDLGEEVPGELTTALKDSAKRVTTPAGGTGSPADDELADLLGLSKKPAAAPAASAAGAATPSAAPAPFLATPSAAPSVPGGDELGDEEKAEPTPDDETAE